jgi:hypothetical protein
LPAGRQRFQEKTKPVLRGAVIPHCLSLIMAGLPQKTGLAAFQPPDGFGAVLPGTLGGTSAHCLVAAAIFGCRIARLPAG